MSCDLKPTKAVRWSAIPPRSILASELGGSEVLSPLEVITILEEMLVKTLEVESVLMEQLEAEQAGASDLLAKALAAFKLACATGNVIRMEETLVKFPVELTSVREYVRQAVSD